MDRSSDGSWVAGGTVGLSGIGAATTQSRGVSFGEIDAMRETERAIRTVLQVGAKDGQYPVYHVIVSMAGGNRGLRFGRLG